MSFNFNYGGMGGYGDMSWLKNGNQGDNQQPTTDDSNAFNNELNNLWGGSIGDMFCSMGTNGSMGAIGSFGDLTSGSSMMSSLGGMIGGSGMIGAFDDMLGGLTGDSENSMLGGLSGLGTMGAMGSMGDIMSGSDVTDSLGEMMGRTTTGSMDIKSMISGFMSMIMGFFSNMMGMFSGGNSSGGMDLGNMFAGFAGDTTVDGSAVAADEVVPENPNV